MTCRDVEGLLHVFFDGELDAKQMRLVAMHTAHCPACEAELRFLESIQQGLRDSVEADLAEVDFDAVWAGIADRLPAARPSWGSRLSVYWNDFVESLQQSPGLPMAVAAAAAVLVALALFARVSPNADPGASQLAEADYSSSIERLETSSDAVAVFDDPDTGTKVLWIGNDFSGVER